MVRSTWLLVLTLFAMLMVLSVVAAAEPDALCVPPTTGEAARVARTDHQPSGNRVVDACGPLGREAPLDVDLRAVAAWILPDPGDRGTAWIVAYEDGSLDRVALDDAGVVSIETDFAAPLAPAAPPVATLSAQDGSSVNVRDAFEDLEGIVDVLPGSRMVSAPGGTVALTEPTDRYQHGVLGDDLEAASFEIQGADGDWYRTLVGDQVIEGLSAMLVDLDGDGLDAEIVLTLSDTTGGARLAVFDLAGDATTLDLPGRKVAMSEPIGQGYRWMHQIGAGSTGPGGEVEIIAVKTPHIGGIVEAYRLIDGELRLVASEGGYSSHRLGSSNLDMALLADVDADGQLDVIVPTQDMRMLGVLARDGDGFAEIATFPLDATLVTNVAATADEEGRLVLAAGTGDARMRVFR